MKINKLKVLTIAMCCLVASLWSEIQSMDDKDVSPVTVRVWNDGMHNGDRVGHVSIDTGERYISLWPSTDRSCIKGAIGVGGLSWLNVKKLKDQIIAAQADGVTLLEDLGEENRAPEQVYQLALNTRKINNYWDRLCEEASKTERSSIADEPPYARIRIEFKDLVWYVGGDPSKHKVEEQEIDDLSQKLQGKFYSCSSIALHMLVIGDIYQRCNIDEDILLNLIPAAQRSWYCKLLSEPENFLAVEEPLKELEIAVSDFAKILRPLVSWMTASDYITPWQVGELVRRCCVKQYIASLKVSIKPSQEEKLRAYLEDILNTHYPEKVTPDTCKEYHKFLTDENPAKPTTDQKLMLHKVFYSYIYAKGRTIIDFQGLLQKKIQETS